MSNIIIEEPTTSKAFCPGDIFKLYPVPVKSTAPSVQLEIRHSDRKLFSTIPYS